MAVVAAIVTLTVIEEGHVVGSGPGLGASMRMAMLFLGSRGHQSCTDRDVAWKHAEAAIGRPDLALSKLKP